MDVDSRMTTESDSDSDTAAQGGGFGSETSSASPSVLGTPTAMGAGGGATIAASATAASAMAVVAGPRPAPGYTVVNAVMDKKEDGAGCRCGHTLTAVPVVGEEGSPGYVGPRLILFGGATALEGNSSTPPSPAGSAGIRNAFQPSPALVSYGFVDGLVC
ncbi:hypothetical protein GUJ93_ZPchr0007g5540 [Zizania palustris]|uniref:Uncharacterized protein n=1 Tax=Zizania palustris TaxID=103762 RepID=A0A8J5TFE1_ZIZPA|nr:hypothetical protein GUJ93_ZPchr0007g5540 [Zizania palustris]